MITRKSPIGIIAMSVALLVYWSFIAWRTGSWLAAAAVLGYLLAADEMRVLLRDTEAEKLRKKLISLWVIISLTI